MKRGNLRLDGFLPYRINVLASHLSRRLAQVYGERFGISIAEWRVIAHLASEDKISVREIFERVDMDKSKISRAASNLEANGLIEKKTSAADRRPPGHDRRPPPRPPGILSQPPNRGLSRGTAPGPLHECDPIR